MESQYPKIEWKFPKMPKKNSKNRRKELKRAGRTVDYSYTLEKFPKFPVNLDKFWKIQINSDKSG